MTNRNPIAGVLIWILMVGIMGFSSSCSSPPTINNFKVDYHAEYTSGGGDRILDVIYTVRNGVIVACEGTYSFPPSSDQELAGNYDNNVEPCDVQKLKNKEYNVPLELITSISKKYKMSDEVDDGPSRYRYRIILEQK